MLKLPALILQASTGGKVITLFFLEAAPEIIMSLYGRHEAL